MAGTAKGYTPSEIVQGPGDLWFIPTAPIDATLRLTLASDGTPDATAHPNSVHLGAIKSAITTAVKPKLAMIDLEQYDAPFDSYVTELTASIEAELAQTEAAKLQRVLGVGVYATASGYKQVTWGGNLVVPTGCIAMISPTRANAARYIVSLLFKGVATGGFTVAMGRAKESTYKAKFEGMGDPARMAGQSVGIIYQTLADAAGGTPTAKDFVTAQLYQGPADLWALTAPTDVAQRVTLDATTLTPDSTAHAGAAHLGGTTGPVTLTVTPKIGYMRMDQIDAPVDCFVEALECKIEAECNQSTMAKLARALGVGTFTTSAGAYDQVTFGGTNQPPVISVAAIGLKRTDVTKAVVMCLYRVNSVDGITVVADRKKASTYKVTFQGLLDPTRTAGRQIGIFHEMI
jgi:hypothetical protein